MEIVYLKLSELTPYENNARHHDNVSVEVIKNSIKDFDFNDPIGVWGNKNVIIEGHGRYMAAKELGLKEVPCIRLDHLTDEQKRAYALAHNRTGELSAWDFPLLDEELSFLEELDMSRYGFQELHDSQIDSLWDDFGEPEKKTKQIQCPECGEWFDI